MLGSRLLPAGAACGIALCAAVAADAATLRAFRLLPGATVRLSDLFADLAAPDRELGPAPAPGARILVQAPQLAAIARDFGVDWRPVTGAEQATLERDAHAFTQAQLMILLRPKLAAAGAPANSGISLAGYAPPMLPTGAAPDAQVTDFDYDAASSRFAATLVLTLHDAPPAIERIAGEVVAMVNAASLTHRLRGGTVLTQDDVREAALPAATLRGEAPVAAAAAVGLALRRDTQAGQPLVAGDLVHPMLVTRNTPVRMELAAGAIALAAEGRALEDGALGAHIRVQNPSSRAVMLAEVTGADEVRIMPGHAPVVVAAQ